MGNYNYTASLAVAGVLTVPPSGAVWRPALAPTKKQTLCQCFFRRVGAFRAPRIRCIVTNDDANWN